MFASEIYQPGRLRLIDVPEPEPDAPPGQVLIQPELGCLCGSDVPFFMHSAYLESGPKTAHSLHEIVARVLASTSDTIAEGERIVCKVPEQRGLRERFWMPEVEAVPLLPELTDEQCVLAQPLGTVLLALRKLPALAGTSAAVVGQGPMGQLWCAALRVRGVAKLMAIDPVPERLQMSPRMGATDVINPTEVDPIEAVHAMTDGKGADLVVEAAGHHEMATSLCISLCRDFGIVYQFGIPVNDKKLNLKELFRKNLYLYTSVEPDPAREYGQAMRWIRDGTVDVLPLVTHRFPVTEIQDAFELFRDRRDGAVKVFVEFP